MQAQHVAIDGSVVTIESDVELRGGPVTGAGWAVVPSLMQAHPFISYPAGHSQVIVDALRANFPDVEVGEEEELSVKGGRLRVGEVGIPRDGGHRRIAVAAWEGQHGCLTTSMPAERRRTLIEALDTLQFSEEERGVAIQSPVATRPRPPELIQEIDGLGVLAVRPAVSIELERVPREAGHRTRHGEVFRVRADSRALLLLGRGSVARLQPRAEAADEELAEAVEGLRIEWTPRPARRAPR